MGSQAWCYSSLSRHVIQVCGMLHQSGSTFRHGALFLILHFQMVSTRCKRNGKSTVVLHSAFQTHHPGLRNVAPIWIHIPTWCTFSHPTFANGDSYMFNLVTCAEWAPKGRFTQAFTTQDHYYRNNCIIYFKLKYNLTQFYVCCRSELNSLNF